MFAELFPLSHIKNIAMFYVLSVVYNAWIIAGVWVFIWGAFMTKTEIGISDSITFAIGFLIELPSGVMADLIGRRRAILLGNIMLTLGNLLVGMSSSFISITIWYLVWTVGYAFQSGATEALAYDSLKKAGLVNKWGQVITTYTIIGKVSSLTSTALGGVLFAIGFRLPYLAAAAVGVVGIAAACGLQEVSVRKPSNVWSIDIYLKQIKDGLGTLAKPRVVNLATLCLTISGIGYMYNWGLLRPLTGERFGFTPTTYAFLLSISSLTVITSMSTFGWLQKKLALTTHVLMGSLIYAATFFIVGFPHSLIVGGALMILLSVMLTHIEILFSQFINEHTSPKHRATTLSAVALFTKLPYVLLALIIGKIAENNQLPLYTLIVGVTALLVWGITYSKRSLFMTVSSHNPKRQQ